MNQARGGGVCTAGGGGSGLQGQERLTCGCHKVSAIKVTDHVKLT